MGHVINPISQRLGYSRFWNATWAITNLSNSYGYLAIEDTLIAKFLRRVFLKITKKIFRKGATFLNMKLIRYVNNINLIVYFKLKPLDSLFFKLLTYLKAMKKNTQARRRKTAWIKKKKQQKRAQLVLEQAYADLNSTIPFKILDLTPVVQPAKIQRTLSRKLVYLQNPNRFKVIQRLRLRLLTNLKRINNRNPFIVSTLKLLKFNPEISKPDGIGYSWNVIKNLLNVYQHKTSSFLKIPKNYMIEEFPTYLMSYIINKSWLMSLQKFLVLLLKNFYNRQLHLLDVILVILPITAVTASFIATYISAKLLKRFPLRRLVNGIMWQMKRLYQDGGIAGFKIVCNGRFERRGRATHSWKKIGKIPRSTVSIDVDYFLALPILINSICAIKVWVTHLHSSKKILII